VAADSQGRARQVHPARMHKENAIGKGWCRRPAGRSTAPPLLRRAACCGCWTRPRRRVRICAARPRCAAWTPRVCSSRNARRSAHTFSSRPAPPRPRRAHQDVLGATAAHSCSAAAAAAAVAAAAAASGARGERPSLRARGGRICDVTRRAGERGPLSRHAALQRPLHCGWCAPRLARACAPHSRPGPLVPLTLPTRARRRAMGGDSDGDAAAGEDGGACRSGARALTRPARPGPRAPLPAASTLLPPPPRPHSHYVSPWRPSVFTGALRGAEGAGGGRRWRRRSTATLRRRWRSRGAARRGGRCARSSRRGGQTQRMVCVCSRASPSPPTPRRRVHSLATAAGSYEGEAGRRADVRRAGMDGVVRARAADGIRGGAGPVGRADEALGGAAGGRVRARRGRANKGAGVRTKRARRSPPASLHARALSAQRGTREGSRGKSRARGPRGSRVGCAARCRRRRGCASRSRR